jgi:hypothetical protein
MFLPFNTTFNFNPIKTNLNSPRISKHIINSSTSFNEKSIGNTMCPLVSNKLVFFFFFPSNLVQNPNKLD